MNTLKTKIMLCPCCMEKHEMQIISVAEKNVFKGVPVQYTAEYFYCNLSDETYADERQISLNDISMKDAYREKTGLLTSKQITAIRAKYGISQSDLCLLLGWGGKTITRYESHQVQDFAHDTILRKLSSDPEWFLQLLQTKRNSFSFASFVKYREAGTAVFKEKQDQYLKSAIFARCIHFCKTENASMPFDTNAVTTVSDASQDFTIIAQIAEKYGYAVIYENNSPRYIVNKISISNMAEDETQTNVLSSAEGIMDLYDEAFRELSR